MEHTIAKTTYHVNLFDAEPCEGVTTGLRKVTVVPHSAEINVYSGGMGTKVDLTGPKVKEDGSWTTAHFTVTVDTRGGMYVEPSQQILDLIAEVTGAAEPEYQSSPGDGCVIEDTYVDHLDPRCELYGKKTDRRTMRVIS